MAKEARIHKSVQLREFCAAYIVLCVQAWGEEFLRKDCDALEETIKKCLLDASPHVRTSMRDGFYEFR